MLAFLAGAAICVIVGLVAGVGKTDTVTADQAGKHHRPAVTSTHRVTVTGSVSTVKAPPRTKTVTTTATVSNTTTTTVSTTTTVTTTG